MGWVPVSRALLAHSSRRDIAGSGPQGANKGSECLVRFLIPPPDTPCSSGHRHTPIASPAVVSDAPSPLESVHSQWPPLFRPFAYRGDRSPAYLVGEQRHIGPPPLFSLFPHSQILLMRDHHAIRVPQGIGKDFKHSDPLVLTGSHWFSLKDFKHSDPLVLADPLVLGSYSL